MRHGHNNRSGPPLLSEVYETITGTFRAQIAEYPDDYEAIAELAVSLMRALKAIDRRLYTERFLSECLGKNE